MTVRLIAAAAMVSSLASAPANAASFAFASADLEVSLLSAGIDVLSTVIEEREIGLFTETEDGSGVVDTFDGGFSTLSDEWVASFTLLSTTGPAPGVAVGEYSGAGGFVLDNTGPTDAEATFLFSWDFDIETATDSALLDLAMAEIALSVTARPSPADFDGVAVFEAVSSSIANGARFDGASFSHTFTIPAQSDLSIAMRASGRVQAETRAQAETIAPIPLPAAGWMLVAGLGALAAMRRRA